MINRTKMVTIKASSMVLLDFFGVLALVVILFTGLHLPEFFHLFHFFLLVLTVPPPTPLFQGSPSLQEIDFLVH